MSRDMKPRKTSARGKSAGSTLIGLFIGLVIGVLCAAGVVWYIFKTPPPFANKGQPIPSVPAAGAAATPSGPLVLGGKPGEPIPQASDKPRFDFYKILPGNSDEIPDPKPGAQPGEKRTDGKSKGEAESALKEPVYLQVGSFQNAADADNQKAKLAMLGAEAAVQQDGMRRKGAARATGIHNAQVHARTATQHIDGRPAVKKILHHLARHSLGKR